ncbi:MAG: hypothetical protein ACI8ZB_004165 [Desulforhopalus sp.]|jgi:hypothetical protein
MERKEKLVKPDISVQSLAKTLYSLAAAWLNKGVLPFKKLCDRTQNTPPNTCLA